MNDLARRLAQEERAGPHPYLRPRNAATLIVIDRTEAEPRLLMGRRHERHVFLPGKFVFPGGRVDRADLLMPVADDLHPAVAEQLMRSLGKRQSLARARALALAAVRETYEEAGLLIGRPATPHRPAQDAYDGFTRRGLLPSLGGLTCIARAITPPGRPRRFDTRFFAADASTIAARLPEGLGPSGELGELAWLTFDEALTLDMPLITRLILGDLRGALERGLIPGSPAPFYHMRGRQFLRETM